ncbi:MAG: DUF4838 domain-containing protein [Victivallales bacterium]|nr:DUF4838 domain-containing protein [Victivallales bacterium]
MRTLLLFFAMVNQIACLAGELTLVTEGKSQALIVIADKPNPCAEYAAQELADYIQKATGAILKIKKESDVRDQPLKIYVGTTEAAKRVGLGQDKFKKEAYTIRVVDKNLYIVGGENNKPLLFGKDPKRDSRENGKIIWQENGIVRNARRGTLYAVYDFLDRFLGIKWLWPGELGTYIPKSQMLAVADDLNINGSPAFDRRKYRIIGVNEAFFRNKQYGEELNKLSFSSEGLEKYTNALHKYLLIYQEGDSEPSPALAHHTCSMWRKYGEEHPEWFALRDDGKRGADSKWGVSRLCVSNPELIEFMVEKNWDGREWISLGESDVRGFCRCKTCLEWDKPQPADFKGYSTTNRYLRYAKKVRELALKKNPDAKVSILMYMDYLHPPTGKPDLSWMYGKFVPWGSGFACYYPMKESEAVEIKDAWKGWYETGIRMDYRPNYLLSGYTLPALDLKQSGEMIKFAGEHGMEGFDYDQLLGYWSTKGPMLYIHMRLGINPNLSIDKILKDYYSAFGPAAAEVEKYFNYWAEYTKKLPRGGVTYGNAREAGELYPPEVFEKPEQILAEALKLTQVSNNSEFAERVRFLQNGLEHAKISVDFSRLFVQNNFMAARKKLDELIEFRRKHEKDFIADYIAAQFAEMRGYKGLKGFMQGKNKYFSDPHLKYGKFEEKSVTELRGMRPNRWSLALPKNNKTGYVVFKYDAGTNNHFVDAELTIDSRATKINNTLELSFDGKNYQLIDSDVKKKKINLTSYVKGKKIFYMRYTATRKTDANDVEMTLIRFRMDYSKENPEEVKQRPKLEIGAGWLDFTPKWYFKKDVNNIGISEKEMKSEAFPRKGWINVEVPARLEITAVGPYLGTGWYAAEFNVPKDWSARAIDFLFEAVDEQAWVYLNGKQIGEHSMKSEGVGVSVLWNEPFIIHAKAEYIKPGAKNLLVVKTHASEGAHGIWKPVKIRPVDASALE